MTPPPALEEQIDQWRSYLRRRQASHSVDVAELEGRLREHLTRLAEAGLAADEAFLVAVKRVGNLNALTRDFARDHSDRLWRQPVPSDSGKSPDRTDAFIAVAFAVAAAVALKLPALFGKPMTDGNKSFYVRNASLFVLPLLTGYFVWKRRLAIRTLAWLAAAFVAAALFANVYPLKPQGHTEVLIAAHLPIALWLIVGIARGRWSQVAGRMDFIRFSGELFIYYVLIALGGGVFTGFLALLFNTIGIRPDPFIQNWLIPCGAAGAVVVASWLVEAKQSVMENMAPVLTRLFTPLFAALLVTFLGLLVFTGRGINIQRDLLIAFDLLLVVVLGLLLYTVSARDPGSPRSAFDIAVVVLLISALVVDAVALWAIAARITGSGLTPNRVAALGLNVILLVNLAWSTVLYLRFLKSRAEFPLPRGEGQGEGQTSTSPFGVPSPSLPMAVETKSLAAHGASLGQGEGQTGTPVPRPRSALESTSFTSLEKWQTDYLPVYGVWAAIVVILFPPLFRYI